MAIGPISSSGLQQGSSLTVSEAKKSVGILRNAQFSTGAKKQQRRRFVAGTAFVDATLNWSPPSSSVDATAYTEVIENASIEQDNRSSNENHDPAIANSAESTSMDYFILTAEAGGRTPLGLLPILKYTIGFLDSECFGVIGEHVTGFLDRCGGLLDELLDKLVTIENI